MGRRDLQPLRASVSPFAKYQEWAEIGVRVCVYVYEREREREEWRVKALTLWG